MGGTLVRMGDILASQLYGEQVLMQVEPRRIIELAHVGVNVVTVVGPTES